MSFNIELYHKELSEYKYFVNDVLVSEGLCNQSVTIDITPSDSKISLWFMPWKIKPLVRVDGCLVNYALANICQYDHMLELVVNDDFFDQYHQADIDSRVHSIFNGKPVDRQLFDLVVGHGKSHCELVKQIKEALDIE